MCEIIITKPEGSTLRETIVSEAQVSPRDKLHPEKAETVPQGCVGMGGAGLKPPGGEEYLITVLL